MSEKIIVITTKELRRYFEETFEKIKPSCEIEIHEYDNFKNITAIYSSLEDKADGFIISGTTAKEVINKSCKDIKKPMLSVGMDFLVLYRMLLNLKIENNNLNLNRIIVDFFVHFEEKLSLVDFIRDTNAEQNLKVLFDKWSNNTSLEELYSLEEHIIEKISSLWTDKKIDLVVCVYSSIVPKLRDMGIPCVYAYPSIENILNITNTLLHEIKINQLSGNLPAVISIRPQEAKSMDISEWKMVSLHKCLLDYKHNEITDFLIQREKDEFFIITNFHNSKEITDSENYKLEDFLEKSLDFKIDIGYGIGHSITQAKNNAINAKKEATIHGKSFLIDENNNLIGPLKSDNVLKVSNEVTPHIQQIAKKAQLSTLTIQKLISIMNLMDIKEMTSQDIVSHMGVTIRNANRIISNLEKNGLAYESHERSTNTKGRPLKVYHFLF